MNKRLTSKQIKQITRLYIAETILCLDGFAFHECGLLESDIDKIVKEVTKYSVKISGKEEKLFGSMANIVNYVLTPTNK